MEFGLASIFIILFAQVFNALKQIYKTNISFFFLKLQG